MTTPTHLLINASVVYAVNFITGGETLFLGPVLFANVLDLDHFSTMVLERNYNLVDFAKLHSNQYKNHIFRKYPAHTLEFCIILLFLGLLSGNEIIKSFFFGWIIHLICDAIRSIWYSKGDLSWFNYWLLYKWKTLK